MKLQLPSLKKNNLSRLLAKRLHLVLWVLLALLVVGEGFALKQSADLIIAANQEPPFTAAPPGVRLNFDGYHAVEQRFQSASAYAPAAANVQDPFNGLPAQGAAPAAPAAAVNAASSTPAASTTPLH